MIVWQLSHTTNCVWDTLTHNSQRPLIQGTLSIPVNFFSRHNYVISEVVLWGWDISPWVGWKWEWSYGVGKSEMNIFLCHPEESISYTLTHKDCGLDTLSILENFFANAPLSSKPGQKCHQKNCGKESRECWAVVLSQARKTVVVQVQYLPVSDLRYNRDLGTVSGPLLCKDQACQEPPWTLQPRAFMGVPTILGKKWEPETPGYWVDQCKYQNLLSSHQGWDFTFMGVHLS